MKEYLSTLFIICLFSAVCSLICESVSCASVSRAVRIICSLCVIIAVFSAIMPLEKLDENQIFLSYADTYQAYSEKGYDIVEMTRIQYQSDIKNEIYRKFGIKANNVSIKFSAEQTENECIININDATIELEKGVDEGIKDAIRLYAKDMLGIDVRVKGE